MAKWSEAVRMAPAILLVAGPALALGITLPPGQPATVEALRKFTSNACVPFTAAALDAMGVPAAAVKSLSYYASGGSADMRNSANRLDAYVGITTGGSIVVHHDVSDCAVITAYSSGGARIPRPLPR